MALWRLPGEISEDFRAAIRRVNPDGLPFTCKAKIVGGWDRGRRDRGYFGVKLSISWPPKRDKRVPATERA